MSLWLCSWLETTKKSCVLVVKSNDEGFLSQFCNNYISLEDRQLKQYDGTYEEYFHSKKVAVSDDQPPFQFIIPEKGKVVPPILQLVNAKHEYTPGQPIFEDANIDIGLNSRIALMGAKGAGKTTLINILAGDVFEGMNRSRYLRIGHFNQLLIEELDLEQSVHRYMDTTCKAEMRSDVLQCWLSIRRRHKKLRSLTPGQKTALVFACLAAKRPHILLIDDPTKSMEIETIASLSMALRKWKGGFLLASNNVRLIDAAICDVWVCGNRGLMKHTGDILDYKEQIKDRSAERLKLGNSVVIREFYPKFAIVNNSSITKNADVIHPSFFYEEYVDCFRESYKPNCIPLTEYEKQRALVTSAPKVGLKEGDMRIEGEVNKRKTYRMTTDPGRPIGHSLLEVVHDSKAMGESLSDFSESNVWVGPKGTVFLKGVERMPFCDIQFRRNHMQAHKILSDLYSKGGAIPDDILHLLNMIKTRPGKCHLYHVHASFIPISQTGPLYMRMQEHVLCKISSSAIQNRIFMAIPYVEFEKWHYLFKDNLILIETYNYKNGRYILPPLQVPITSQQMDARCLIETKNFLRCLKNRVKHRMDYVQTGKNYLAMGSDLATQARFSLVNCVLQDELDNANETKDLKLHEFL